MTEMEAGVVLLVDDDELVRRSVGRNLVRKGYRVVLAETAEEACVLLREEPIDVVLTDVHLPGLSGVELLDRVARIRSSAGCLVFTGLGDIQTANTCLEKGAADYFEKPIENWARFFAVLQRSVSFARLKQENAALRKGGELFGNAGRMAELRAHIEQIADSAATVLIHGESGTGKEVVARELHRASGRPGAFTAINCAAIPSALIESELFGHVRGAHSTATEDRGGLLRAADEGTLLLDEIGDMPLELQAKLLRVLESRRFRPVGGDTEHRLTARILAASHRDLNDAVARGTFRQDLLFRLNVVTLEVPALRDRVGDVPLLVYRFVDHFARMESRDVRQVTREAMTALEHYSWPGNVRELKNVVHRAVLLCVDGEVRAIDLQLGANHATPPVPVAAGEGFSAYLERPYQQAKDAILDAFTREYLQFHLAESDTVTAAAARAGMARPNFSRLMKRHGVDNGS